jgi:hypothetical protein
MNIDKLRSNPHYKLNKYELAKLRIHTQEIQQTDGGVVAPKPKRKRRKKLISQ